MSYYVIMQNYSHLICVRTKEFTDEIKDSLEWVRGGYDVILASKMPTFIDLDSIDMEEEEEFLDAARISQATYFHENDKEIIDRSFKIVSEALEKED